MKILMVIYKTLGDVILGSAIVAELKKKYPESEITFAVHPEYVELVDTNPDVKNLIIGKEHDVVLKEAVSGRYDIVLFTGHMNHTDGLWHHVDKHKDGHLVDFYAKRSGVEITDRRTYMFPSEADMSKATTIATNWPNYENKTIAIHTSSLVAEKNWPWFDALVTDVREKYSGCQIIQLGGPNDPLLKDVDDHRGKLTYNEIAALLSMSDLFIGVDSGLTYIADSVECPIVCIMGMSTASTSGPISGRACFIEPTRPPECEWSCHTHCRLGTPCINTVTVEEVLKHVEEEISRKSGGVQSGADTVDAG